MKIFNHIKRNFSLNELKITIDKINNDKIKSDDFNQIKENLGKNISKIRLKHIKLLVNSFNSLNENEFNYFFNKMTKITNFKSDHHLNFEKNISDKENLEKKKLLEDSLLNDDFIEKLGLNAQSGTSSKATEIEEKVVEKVEEKKNFDLFLEKFDAKKKLIIIKELKTIFNLGLKEAKELVEKSPVILKKNILKDEAEKFKEKLEGLGCNIILK